MTSATTVGGLDMIEFVSGVVLGIDRSIPEPPRLRIDPRVALEQILVPALSEPPCGVSFSGGRDSSTVLAVAADVARTHQLPLPIPVSLRFPEVDGTDESDFQELVVRHIGLTEWLVLEPGETLDIMGDLATDLTRRHGLLYPPNVHFHAPICQALGGGTLLTGLGGDEVLEPQGDHELAAMLAGKVVPNQVLLRGLLKRYIFRDRRRAQVHRQYDPYFPWLLPEAKQELLDRLVDWMMDDPLSAGRSLTASTFRMRYLHRAVNDLARMAEDYEISMLHPFLDPVFVGAVAERAGWTGPGSRTEMLRSLFGDLLPERLVERTSKAQFDDVFWGPLAAETAPSLPVERFSKHVDGPALRDFWRSDTPKGATFLIAKHLRANPADE